MMFNFGKDHACIDNEAAYALLDALPAGSLRWCWPEPRVGQHHFVIVATLEEGFHTARRRYFVGCAHCEALLHPCTTGPLENIEQHMWRVARGETQ